MHLCEVYNDDGSCIHVGMTAIMFILHDLFPLDGFDCNLCLLHNLNTIWNSSMTCFPFLRRGRAVIWFLCQNLHTVYRVPHSDVRLVFLHSLLRIKFTILKL